MTEDECAVGRPFEVLIQVPSSDKRAEKAGLVASARLTATQELRRQKDGEFETGLGHGEDSEIVCESGARWENVCLLRARLGVPSPVARDEN